MSERSPEPVTAGPTVALSTSSVWPESTAVAFEVAARLGYDGVELMVSADPVSQDLDTLRRLVDYHQMPVLSVHSPCLLISQRVWGTEPWAKLMRSQIAAERLGAKVVVTHPPFRWQRCVCEGVHRRHRAHARGDRRRLRRREHVSAARPERHRDRHLFAVLVVARCRLPARHSRRFACGCCASRSARLARAVSAIELAHVHLADGTGSRNDEHLVPGRGTQPCAELLTRLARSGYRGVVVLEVNTRRAAIHEERIADLAESLAFARSALASRRGMSRSRFDAVARAVRRRPARAIPTRCSTRWRSWPDSTVASARVADVGAGTGIATRALHEPRSARRRGRPRQPHARHLAQPGARRAGGAGRR